MPALSLVTLLGVLPAVAPTPFQAEDGQPWSLGQPVPELRLPTIDGAETIDLAQLRGKKLVLIEFASW